MRRVLHLAGWYLPDSVGGTEHYVHWLARDLRRLGTDSVVAAPSANGRERDYEIDGVPVHRYRLASEPTPAELGDEGPPRYFEEFADWLRAVRPDIVHLHSVTRGCGYHHAALVRALGIPLVMTCHVAGVVCVRSTLLRWGRVPCDGAMRAGRCAACRLTRHGVPRLLAWPLASLDVERPRIPTKLGRRVGSALATRRETARHHERTRAVLAIASRVIAVAGWLRDVLLRNGVSPEHLVYSPHGLPEEYPRRPAGPSKLPGEVLELGYVGRLNPIKGVDTLVRAFRRLPPRARARLHIHGSARGAEELRFRDYLIALAAGDPRIAFHGGVAASERHTVFQGLDALAVPSLALESGPLVVLEGFAAGLPVVGSNAGGIPELVTEDTSGMLAPPGDVAAWGDTLRRLHRQLVVERRPFAIPAIRSSRLVASDMCQVYERVLHSSPFRAARISSPEAAPPVFG